MENSSDSPAATELVAERIAELTLKEKVFLLSGHDTWRSMAVVRGEQSAGGSVLVPPIKMTDGPIGARGDSTTGAKSVCLPSVIAMAATFDTSLIGSAGQLLGRETARKSSQVLLAPTLNLARHPLGGRNFESFGEEPNLVAAMASSYISGVQSVEGVVACAKHWACNDSEWARLYVSSEVDAQTLREVYFVPFEAAVAVGVGSIMSAYSKLNGVFCSENRWLLTTVLRDEWGFDGVVISDWGATHEPADSIEAGLDLEMPGPPIALGDALLAAVNAGEVTEAQLDERIANVIALALRTHGANTSGAWTEPPEQSVDEPEERVLAATIAAAGMVLLRNEPVPAPEASGQSQPLLPLQNAFPSAVLGGAGLSVAVIGPNAVPGVSQGGGSAEVPAHYQVTPLEGLHDVLGDSSISFHQGCFAERYVPKPSPEVWSGPIRLEKFDSADMTGSCYEANDVQNIEAFIHGFDERTSDPLVWSWRWTGRMSPEVAGLHEFGLFAVGQARVLVNGEVIVDNWSDPKPGFGYFQKASDEVAASVHLEAGVEVDVVVEWSRGDDDQLAGLRFGYQPPVDHNGLLAEAVAAAAANDVAVVMVGLNAEWETESHDRVDYCLPGRQDELVTAVAAANPNTVVVVNAGGPVDLPWLDEVPATLVVWYPGQEFGTALAQVLTGLVEPGGRLPVTFPKSMADAPTATSVPSSTIRPELSSPGEPVVLEYSERLLIGHRWYHDREIVPRASFGHGLGYTTFNLGAPEVDAAYQVDASAVAASENHQTLSITVPVHNTGTRTGKCVAQVYSRPTDEAVSQLSTQEQQRPRVLAGFASVVVGENKRANLEVEIPARVFCRWDVENKQWSPILGKHQLDVGLSSTDIRHHVEVTVG